MAVTEYYTAFFAAIVTALEAATGPWASATSNVQVRYWAPEGQDDVVPDEELLSALMPPSNGPVALLAYDGSDAGEEQGDAVVAERINFSIRYGVRVPGDDWKNAYEHTGTNYWGEFATRRWIIQQVSDNNVVGNTRVMTGPIFDGIEPISVLRQRGVLAYTMRWHADYQHVVGADG